MCKFEIDNPRETNKEVFINLARQHIARAGIDKLLAYLEATDFYEAPSSTRFHGAYAGGLLAHSLNVYYALKEKKDLGGMWGKILSEESDETIALVSLFHDICKVGQYKAVTKRKELPDGSWTDTVGYEFDVDAHPYGHGELSVWMLSQFMKLSASEAYAIRWHMGAYCGADQWNTLSAAQEKYPLCLALHEADMEASRLMEVTGADRQIHQD